MRQDTGHDHVTRRTFMKASAAAAVAAPLFPHIVTSKNKARKSNLLFIWTDEQRADTMAAYGNAKIHAPNLNKLASESVVFEKAYVTQPVCTPSRSTVMTGQWPHENGCVQNNIALEPDCRTVPELLGDSVYRTGYFGKWHLGDEVFRQHGFEEWRSIEDIYGKYYGADRDADAHSTYHDFLAECGYRPDSSSGCYSRGFAARLPIEHCKPKYIEREACGFLDRHRDEPFMLYLNFLEPHMPFYGPLDDEHPPGSITLPINFSDPLEANEPEVYKRNRQERREKGYEGHDLTTEAGWRQLIAQYWGLVTQVDLSVGAILEHLERLGLADDTMVVYTSDHGDMMGSHQMLAKCVMYEEAVRVPWLMRIPTLGRKQRKIAQPVSHIDLVPTVLDFLAPGNSFDLSGKSLRPAAVGDGGAGDDVFIEWTEPQPYEGGRNPYGRARRPYESTPNHVRTVVSPDGWKLCLHTHDRNQLFNLHKDPGETVNVYDVAGNKEVIARLTGRIRAWQERAGDGLELAEA